MRRNMDEVRAELERRRIVYERQKRERRKRLLYTAPIVLLALALSVTLLPWGDLISPSTPPGAPHYAEPTDPRDPPQSVEPSGPQDPSSPEDPSHGSASYRGSVDSFDELVEQADLIVVGTVVSTEAPSSLTETATVRVEAVWRAPEGVPSEIYLYQMKDSYTVAVGGRYLLFLQVQTEGALDGWYSIGGGQGSLSYDAASGRVSGHDVIDGEAATRWLKDNEPIIGTLP